VFFSFNWYQCFARVLVRQRISVVSTIEVRSAEHGRVSDTSAAMHGSLL
jgi:hypothetical protein